MRLGCFVSEGWRVKRSLVEQHTRTHCKFEVCRLLSYLVPDVQHWQEKLQSASCVCLLLLSYCVTDVATLLRYIRISTNMLYYRL